MSSYFCLIKLSARFITDVFRGNRFFFPQKLAFAILRLLLANNTRKLLLIGMNIISISKKKSLKKLTFFLGWHLKNGSDFFFLNFRGFFFHLIPQQRLLIMMTRIQFQYRETITTKLTKSQNIPTARDTHMIVIFNSIF